jgi:hypothetical protein
MLATEINWLRSQPKPMQDNNAKPTIDDRIEALTQSLELLTTLHRDLEQQTASNFDRLTTTMERLTNIVIAHEQRIQHLEGQ